MLEFLKRHNAPRWLMREAIYIKYIGWTCGVWFGLSWLITRLQLHSPAWSYVAAVVLVWFMVELIVSPENKAEHEIMKRPTIRLFLGRTVRPISDAESRDRFRE